MQLYDQLFDIFENEVEVVIDAVVLLRAMRKTHENEDLFIEKSNGKRIVIHPEDEVSDVAGFIMIQKNHRDVAINPMHIISVISKGDL